MLSMSFFPTAESRAWSRASTRPSHSRSLLRASAPSELTFLRIHTHTKIYFIKSRTSECALNMLNYLESFYLHWTKKKKTYCCTQTFPFPWQRLDVYLTRKTHSMAGVLVHFAAEMWVTQLRKVFISVTAIRMMSYFILRAHTDTRLSHTPFSFSWARNAARGKSGSGPELPPRQQMSVLTAAMDTGQSGEDGDGAASGAGDRRAPNLGAHISEPLLQPTGLEPLVGLSASPCVSLSNSPWLSVLAVKAKPDYTD